MYRIPHVVLGFDGRGRLRVVALPDKDERPTAGARDRQRTGPTEHLIPFLQSTAYFGKLFAAKFVLLQ